MSAGVFRTHQRSTLSLLDMPLDPLDVRGLAELPDNTLHRLTDLVYAQLDSTHPSAYALEWYTALTNEWSARMARAEAPKAAGNEQEFGNRGTE